MEVVLNGVLEPNTPCFRYRLPYSFSIVSKRRRDQAEDLDAVDAVVPPSKPRQTGSGRVEKPVSRGAGPSDLDEIPSGESRGPTSNKSSSTSGPPAVVDNHRPAAPTGAPIPSCRPHQAVNAASHQEFADGLDLVIEKVIPKQGPTTGGPEICIWGSNFPTDQRPLYARFGDNFARAVGVLSPSFGKHLTTSRSFKSLTCSCATCRQLVFQARFQ